MVKNRFFGNGDANLHILHVKKACDYFKTGVIIFFDPQNVGLDDFFFSYL